MSQASPQWYCRTLGMELGPMPWSDLVELARQGELTSEDDIRRDQNGAWVQAKSISELAAEFRRIKSSSIAHGRPVPESVGPLKPVVGAGPNSGATAKAVEAALAQAESVKSGAILPRKSAADEERWFCHVSGVAYGPIRFSQLLRIIAHRQLELSPDDYVKHGVQGEWVTVESVPALMRARGRDDADGGGGSPVLPAAHADAIPARDASISRWFDRLPAIPALEPPDWLLTGFQLLGKGLGFVGAYIFIIVPLSVWISINVIAVFYPETGEELGKMAIAFIGSPITWFGLIAFAAYAGAIWLNLRGD